MTELPKANWKERLLLAIGKRQAFRVKGDSMRPTISDGDIVVIDPRSPVTVGDIVLARHPFKHSVKMLKCISAADENGRYLLTGDNPTDSTDSRSFGSVRESDILGKAVGRI